MGRAVRTVQRWEKEANLPVYRLPGGGLERVFAYTDELDEWMHTAKPAGNGNGNGNGDLSPAHPAEPDPQAVPSGDNSGSGAGPLHRTDRTDPTDPTDLSTQPGKASLPGFSRLSRAWKIGLAMAALGLAVVVGLLIWRPA